MNLNLENLFKEDDQVVQKHQFIEPNQNVRPQKRKIQIIKTNQQSNQVNKKEYIIDQLNPFEALFDESEQVQKQQIDLKKFVQLEKKSRSQEQYEKEKRAVTWLDETQKVYQQKVEQQKQEDENIFEMLDPDLFNEEKVDQQQKVEKIKKLDILKKKVSQQKAKKITQIQQQIQQELKPQTLQCQICEQFILAPEFPSHQKQCMSKYQDVPCQYCSQMIIQAFLNEHYEECISKIEYEFKLMECQHAQIECSICCLNIENQDKQILRCLHTYHTWCIQSWLLKKQECPTCRSTSI